jgi:hypothetical protein
VGFGRCQMVASRRAVSGMVSAIMPGSVFHTARLSSRCVRSGVRSPGCCAIVHPLHHPRHIPAGQTANGGCRTRPSVSDSVVGVCRPCPRLS